MIEALAYIINYAAQGPQEFCVVVGFVGVFGWLSKPMEKVKADPRKSAPKRKTKRTVAKKVTVQPGKPKAKKEPKANKPREWAKMHKPDAAEIWRVEEMFRKGRS